MYVAIHGDLSVVGNYNGEGHKGLGKNIGEDLRNLLVHQAIIWNEGLSGRKWLREPNVRVNKII